MSRGLFRFLLFCVSLLVIATVWALALGENKLQFLFHSERSSKPFVMLGFAHADMAGQSKAFESELGSLLEDAEGEILWLGRVTSVLEGREADNWPALALSLYPSRSAFIKQYTKDGFTPPFGIKLPNQRASLMLAASPERIFKERSPVYLLELMQVSEMMDGSLAYDPATAHAGLVSGMQGVWTARLNPVSDTTNQDWQFVRMSGFESRQALGSWLDNIERRTEASLQRRYYRHYVALIIETFPGHDL